MPIPDFDSVWQKLAAAAAGRSAFNFLQLATMGTDDRPQLRTVVLRRCSADPRSLSFVTDIRSAKVSEIMRHPAVALCGYDPVAKTQVRLSGKAAIIKDERERRGMWESLRGGTLILFDAPLPPGTEIDERGVPIRPLPAPEADEPYDRFALVEVTLSRVEWLDLSCEPHLRCAYYLEHDGWRAMRLAP